MGRCFTQHRLVRVNEIWAILKLPLDTVPFRDHHPVLADALPVLGFAVDVEDPLLANHMRFSGLFCIFRACFSGRRFRRIAAKYRRDGDAVAGDIAAGFVFGPFVFKALLILRLQLDFLSQ